MSREPLSFVVPIGGDYFLGPAGNPVAKDKAHRFTVRQPSILDDQRISRRVRELAGSDTDPFAYADMLASVDILSTGLRSHISEALFPEGQTPPEQEKHARAVANAGVWLFPRLARGSVQRAVAELQAMQDGPKPDVLEEALERLQAIPSATVRRLLAEHIEVEHVRDSVAALELAARWWVLSSPQCLLEDIPGWDVHGQDIIRAWREAEDESKRGFMTPSGTSPGGATATTTGTAAEATLPSP